MADQLKRTPLLAEHQHLGAKLVPFAGYEMPVQYPAGIIAEHRAVRTGAGLFDVSHMGELEVRGPQDLDLVQYVTTNDASRLAVGQAQYSVICAEDGGAIDDCLVYRFPDHYMIVVNASNQDKDRDWIISRTGAYDATVVDRSAETALLALQGPAAARILAPLTATDLESVGYYHFTTGDVAGYPAVISRTGYTGEDGFELYLGTDAAVPVWRRIMEAGSAEGILPIGLGARDSLRLEMGYILYGNDLDEQHTPLEAGLGWVVKLDKADFLGRPALLRVKEQGLARKLVGFQLTERGFPRHGYSVVQQGEVVGDVTSGIVSPMLEQGVGMAYVPAAAARTGTAFQVRIRDRDVPAEVVRPPFYKDGSVRK